MKQLVIVDTGCANLASVVFAFERLGLETHISTDPQQISSAERVILPGVGSASAGMAGVEKYDLKDVVRGLQQPVLGICLGMQILAERSDECGADGQPVDCLGIIPGVISELDGSNGLVLPHMGWNTIEMATQSLLFRGVEPGSRFYFVHSFAFPQTEHTIASCDYGQKFSAAVQRDNFYGVQFHPELSGPVGAKVLSNFLEIHS